MSRELRLWLIGNGGSDYARRFVQPEAVIEPSQRCRRPPVGLAEQCHGRGDQQTANDGGIDGYGNRQREAHLLDAEAVSCGEAEEHDEDEAGGGGDDVETLGEVVTTCDCGPYHPARASSSLQELATVDEFLFVDLAAC